MRKLIDDTNCADCLCRVCVKNICNDSYNDKLDIPSENSCKCDCVFGDEIIETEEVCDLFFV